MNTVTTKKSSTLVSPVAPATSEKLLAYLLRTATKGCTSPEDFNRKLVEVTLAHAAELSNKRSNGRSLVTQYAEAEAPLLARIYDARRVMLNTLKKLLKWYDAAPEELQWVRSNAPIVITGIYRESGRNRNKSMTNISAQIAEGKLVLQPTDTVMFKTAGGTWQGGPAEGTVLFGSLSFMELNNDPILLSQKVRSIVKAARRKQEEDEQKADRVEEAELLKVLRHAKERQALIQQTRDARLAKSAKARAKKIGNAAYQAKQVS